MVSSSRQIIVRVFLLLSLIASANAQSADKSASSTISGKVTLGGKGIAGMVVGLADEVPSASIHITNLKAVTDEDGHYQIRNVPPGSYKVLVGTLTYVQNDGPAPVIVGKNEAAENIDIALVRGGVITGKVIDADGRPVLEEEIFFSALSQTGRGLPYLRSVRTDDRGIYRAFGLPAGRYFVSAGKDSIASFGRATRGHVRTYHPSTVNASDATVIAVNEGSEATNVDIMLGRQLSQYTARGRIIDAETLQPVPNAKIGIQLSFTLQGGSGSTSINNAAESTKDGDFKIENLPPGKYAVYLDSPPDSELLSEQVRFEVTDQDVAGLLIKTSKGGTVSGRVVLEGTDDPKVRANLAQIRLFAALSNESSRRTLPTANINPDGTFRLTGLPSGRLMLNLPQNQDHLLLMRIERNGVVYPSGIEVREREQVTGLRVIVSQANGKIRGQLKLPEGVELPATGRLRVWVRRTEDVAGFNSAVEANAQGQFFMDGLVPGTYEFNVDVLGVSAEQRPRLQRPMQTVVVTKGAIADVTIMLQLLTGPSGP